MWTRTHSCRWEAAGDEQHEHYYVVRTPPFDPEPQLTWAELRLEGMTAVRWWTQDELETADALFAPRRLPLLVRELLLHGPPAEPIDVGI